MVSRPVGGDIDPAEAKAGHDHHERANDLLRRAVRDRENRVEIDMREREEHVQDRDGARDPRENRLQLHDRVIAEHARDDDERSNRNRRGNEHGRATGKAKA